VVTLGSSTADALFTSEADNQNCFSYLTNDIQNNTGDLSGFTKPPLPDNTVILSTPEGATGFDHESHNVMYAAECILKQRERQ